MVNRSKRRWPFVALVVMAGLHCNNQKADTTTSRAEGVGQKGTDPPASSSSAGAGASAAPIASAAPPADAGLAEWYACRKNEDCEIVNQGRCCAPCDPSNFVGNYTAINAKFKADYTTHQGCADAKCKSCPGPMPDYPRTDTNFFALCQEGRCSAIDLRFSKYAQCQTAKDCALRFGLKCCEGCGDRDLVTYNPSSTLIHDVCPKKPTCPAVSTECRGYRHPQQNPECVLNRCQLSD